MPFIQDNDGSFWFPGYDVDLFEFNGSNWTEHANILGGNKNANNGRVLLAPNGDIWLRFGHGYVYSFDGSSWTEIIGPKKPKEGAHLFSMEFDEHGNTWFGTTYGVMVYNSKGVTIGTEEPIKPNGMGLFPNPFTHQLNIVLPEQAEKVEVEIFSLTGQKVFERTYQQTDIIILENLHLPQDLYLVVATTQDGVVYSESALLIQH